MRDFSREYKTCSRIQNMKRGQAMIETLIAIALICVVFFGIMQISNLSVSREIIYHAAARGARAKTVGFNSWMVQKSVRVAAIPNSGKMITPQFDNTDPVLQSAIAASQAANRPLAQLWTQVLGGEIIPSSAQYNIERARIPEYMNTDNNWRGDYILNYTGWENDHIHYEINTDNPDILFFRVWQNYTNWLGLPRTFYQSDTVTLSGTNTLENHYLVYINDENL